MPGHPRACGEDATQLIGLIQNRGPSPRVRGGLTDRIKASKDPYGPSPRVRGGREIAGEMRESAGGPSPRVRGGLPKLPTIKELSAGHPRACGEDT